MQQFYYKNATDTAYSRIDFVKPVRKFMLIANRGCLLAVSKESGQGVPIYIPGGQAIYFDMQSSNSGKGVTSLSCKSAVSGQNADFYFSIIEYGSDGDNNWFI